MRTAQRMMITSGTAAVPLALPSLAVAVASDNANTATLVTGSWTPAVNDFLVVGALSRDGNSSTHDSVTASGFTCSFTKRADVVSDDSAGTAMRSSVWTGIVSASASGTLTLTASAAQFQQALIILKVPGATAFDTKGDEGNLTGTTLDITNEGSPDSGALSLVFYCEDGGDTAITISGHTDNVSASGNISDLYWSFMSKLGSPPATWAISDCANTVKAGCGVTIL